VDGPPHCTAERSPPGTHVGSGKAASTKLEADDASRGRVGLLLREAVLPSVDAVRARGPHAPRFGMGLSKEVISTETIPSLHPCGKKLV
jgi:hypothetical protein